MTYSLDFRKKVISVRERDQLTIVETATRFDIGHATLIRWLKKVEPKATRERRCTKITNEALLADVSAHPDDYQYERAERMGVSTSGILKALKRCGISRKKRP